ncbi:MAG: hypothetical protein Q9170_005387 [Blastenia crenularia]
MCQFGGIMLNSLALGGNGPMHTELVVRKMRSHVYSVRKPPSTLPTTKEVYCECRKLTPLRVGAEFRRRKDTGSESRLWEITSSPCAVISNPTTNQTLQKPTKRKPVDFLTADLQDYLPSPVPMVENPLLDTRLHGFVHSGPGFNESPTSHLRLDESAADVYGTWNPPGLDTNDLRLSPCVTNPPNLLNDLLLTLLANEYGLRANGSGRPDATRNTEFSLRQSHRFDSLSDNSCNALEGLKLWYEGRDLLCFQVMNCDLQHFATYIVFFPPEDEHPEGWETSLARLVQFGTASER